MAIILLLNYWTEGIIFKIQNEDFIDCIYASEEILKEYFLKENHEGKSFYSGEV